MSKKGSIAFQVTEIFKQKELYGYSKHDAKIAGYDQQYVFSFSTAKTYIRECINFCKWCKDLHGVKTIESCKPFIREYLDTVRKKNGGQYSAFSLATKASAIAKMYGIEKEKTPVRNRSEITRSRNVVSRDSHYSPEKHKTLEMFSDSTGLRRHEMETLRGDQLVISDGKAYIHITGNQAKGGRERYVRVINNVYLVSKIMQDAGNNRVFGKLPSAYDEHAHRAKYAADLYRMYARDLDTCKRTAFFDKKRGILCQDSVYRCRRDLSGKWYDKQAMLIVSQSLGHNRIDVIAQSYLYALEK